MAEEVEKVEEPDYQIEKARFLEELSNLRPDLYFPEEWSEDEREMALEELKPNKVKTSMYAVIPMTCKASKCSFADTCPLHQKGMAPKGKPCPLEMAMTYQMTQALIEELHVDPNSMTEVAMIRDLVDQEIQYIRKAKLLAKEDFVQEVFIGVSPNGEIIKGKQLHLAVELEDKIHRRKKELRNALMMTREQKAKIGQGHLDTAQTLANIFEDVRSVQIEHEKMVRQKLGISEQDDYIEAQVVDDEGENGEE